MSTLQSRAAAYPAMPHSTDENRLCKHRLMDRILICIPPFKPPAPYLQTLERCCQPAPALAAAAAGPKDSDDFSTAAAAGVLKQRQGIHHGKA